MTKIFQKSRIFWHEMVLELKKASWPSKVELRDSTIVVLIAAFLLGIAILIADWSIFNWVTVLSNLVRTDFNMLNV
jgi:preprotein translocase subunit SecE